jgi:hypothetical protein
MKKSLSLFVVVAGSLMLGACGMPEGAEEAVETQESGLDSSLCTEYTAGSTTTVCRSTADWKAYAIDFCAAKRMTLGSFSVANQCNPSSTTNDSYATARFTCCP